MKKSLYGLMLSIILCCLLAVPVLAEPVVPSKQNQNTVNAETESYSSGRGSYRSPSGSFTGGNRGGAGPGYSTGPRAPSPDVARNPRPAPGPTPSPAAPTGRWGSFFGGLAAGSLLGHLFNPFGGYGSGVGAGFSLLSILFWAVILYAAYKLFQKIQREKIDENFV